MVSDSWPLISIRMPTVSSPQPRSLGSLLKASDLYSGFWETSAFAYKSWSSLMTSSWNFWPLLFQVFFRTLAISDSLNYLFTHSTNYPSFGPFTHVSIHPSVCPFIYPASIHPSHSSHWFSHPSHPSTRSPIYPSIYPFLHLFPHPTSIYRVPTVWWHTSKYWR